MKRPYIQCNNENQGYEHPAKKAKFENSNAFHFDAGHFTVQIPTISQAVQSSPAPEPYWMAVSTRQPPSPMRCRPTYSKVQREDITEPSESSDEEEPTRVYSQEGQVVMAEIVDLPVTDREFYTSSEKLPVDTSAAMLRKLNASKSPIMEALIYCAFNNWGVEIVKQGANGEWVADPDFGLNGKSGVIAFKFSDFDLLSECLERVNSKNKPTTDPGARIKALKRWFDGIPCVRNRNDQFIATVKKTEQMSKVKDMIRRMLKIYWRRLDQVGRTDREDTETPSTYEPLDSTSSVSSEQAHSY
jgi:hypothetical protein